MKKHTIFHVKIASRVISHEKIFFVWWKITRFSKWMNVWENEAIFIENTDFSSSQFPLEQKADLSMIISRE